MEARGYPRVLFTDIVAVGNHKLGSLCWLCFWVSKSETGVVYQLNLMPDAKGFMLQRLVFSAVWRFEGQVQSQRSSSQPPSYVVVCSHPLQFFSFSVFRGDVPLLKVERNPMCNLSCPAGCFATHVSPTFPKKDTNTGPCFFNCSEQGHQDQHQTSMAMVF